MAADNAECSKVGRNILKKGGSAVDAAISTTLCVGVINMHSTGIGGGGFMMVYDSHKRSAEMIDFRETAPEHSGIDLFKGDPLNGIRGNIFIPYFTIFVRFGCRSRESGGVIVCILTGHSWAKIPGLGETNGQTEQAQIRPSDHDIVAISGLCLDIAEYRDSRHKI